MNKSRKKASQRKSGGATISSDKLRKNLLRKIACKNGSLHIEDTQNTYPHRYLISDDGTGPRKPATYRKLRRMVKAKAASASVKSSKLK